MSHYDYHSNCCHQQQSLKLDPLLSFHSDQFAHLNQQMAFFFYIEDEPLMLLCQCKLFYPCWFGIAFLAHCLFITLNCDLPSVRSSSLVRINGTNVSLVTSHQRLFSPSFPFPLPRLTVQLGGAEPSTLKPTGQCSCIRDTHAVLSKTKLRSVYLTHIEVYQQFKVFWFAEVVTTLKINIRIDISLKSIKRRCILCRPVHNLRTH